MTEQLTLQAVSQLEQDFLAFHAAHPDVYDRLVQLALETRARGFEHYGIATLFEVVRHHYSTSSSGQSPKLNNNHRAFYARKIMSEVPSLNGFFATRRQRAA